MATPPFNPDETKPGDGDIVSQFPAVERTFRDIIEDWINFEHDPTGHHAILTGTTAARDAITDWVVGSLWYNTTTSVLQLVISIGPVVWADVSGALGTAAFENIGTSGDAIGKLDTANTWSANQTIEDTDDGPNSGPIIVLDRNSVSPAIDDVIGVLDFTGRSSTGASRQYALIRAFILDPANTVEDGRLDIRTVVAGTFASRISVANGLFTPNATGGDKGADTINASAIYDDGVLLTTPVLLTKQTASGSNVDFTSGIPANAKRLTIMLNDVSLSGTDEIVIQLGDAVGFETSGYSGTLSNVNDSSATALSGLLGFQMTVLQVSGDEITGELVLTLLDPAIDLWQGKGMCSNGAGTAADMYVVVGNKALSDPATQIRVTGSGSNTFTGGTINILVE